MALMTVFKSWAKLSEIISVLLSALSDSVVSLHHGDMEVIEIHGELNSWISGGASHPAKNMKLALGKS
jgi:hypothetical protein